MYTRRHPFAPVRALAAGAVAAALLLVGCGSPLGGDEAEAAPAASATVAKDDTTLVREAYTAYEKAANGNDIEGIVAVTSASTFAYLDDMRKLALTASKKELGKKRFFDQIMVLSLRKDADADVLRTAEPRELMATIPLEDDDVLKQGATTDAAKAKITVTGDKATAADPGDPDASVELVREGEAWKLDFAVLFDGLNEVFEALREMSGKSKASAVNDAALELVDGDKKELKALWKPIGE